MTADDGGQAGLGEFDADADGSDSERPPEEAAAVADPEGIDAEYVDPDLEALPESAGTVEVAITQVDYTVAGTGRKEAPIVHVFGRTPDREYEHVRVHGFRPYFYAPTDSLTAEDLERDRITGYEETDADGDPHESIRGEPLTKIYAQTPRDVGQMRDEFDHFEADILFPNRLLIDKDLRGGVAVPERRAEDGAIDVHHEELDPAEVEADPRVLTLDIEVDDRRGFPEEGEEPIVCLTTHDSYDDEYVAWLYDAPEGDADPPEDLDYDPIGESVDVEVRVYEEEAAMLDALVSYVNNKNNDVLTGWNFEDFDAPYLLDRLDRLDDRPTVDRDLSVERLSRVGEVWRSGWGGPDVKGRVVFDLLYAYKRTQFTELESYRLDAVGEIELGVGKERYPGDIGDLWEDDPRQLLAYNLRDVELCVEIDREQDVIPFWQEVASFVGCKLEDAPTPGDAVDVYVLHEAHGEFALPSKGRQDSEEFEGGAVFDPISGVRENVSVLDLKCFSGDTDVVTPDGIRSVRDLEVGDPVYTLNPETFECEIQPVVDTHSYENEYGQLHHVEGTTHDLKVTENHRFLVSNTRGWDDLGPDDYEFREYRDVPDANRFAFPNHDPMSGAVRDRYPLYEVVDDAHVAVYAHDGLTALRAAVPAAVEPSLDWANGTSVRAATDEKTGKYLVPVSEYRQHQRAIDEHADEVFLKYDRGHGEIPTTFEMDDWLELVGWFVTEGSFVRETPGIVLHQQNPEGRAAIRSLLDRMDLPYSADEDRFYVSSHVLHDWFVEHCGDGAANKRLPEWVFELDAEQLSGLLETLVDGDGSRTDSGLRKFWTTSDRLKEDVTRLAVRCGYKPTVSKQSDGCWYLSIGKRGSFKKDVNATVEDHDGRVHCVTAAENHVVLAGRNGRFQWVGQSLYPMAMVTINASPETKVTEDYGEDTYRAPNGQRFRKSPDGMIRTMVDELLAERENKKELRDRHDPGEESYVRYDRQQQAVKVIMNSLYGVLGWDRFRLYDKEMGAAVTATGREVIEFTEDVANDMDYQVVYGDSVTGDRPVVVRDPSGRVRVLPIADLYDSVAADGDADSDLLVTTDGGPAAEVTVGKERATPDGWEALSMNDDGRAEWQPIEQVIRHETDEEVVTLRHEFGESTTTTDHSFVVEGDEGFVEAPPREVDEPLRVPGVPAVETVESVDLYEALSGYTRTYEDGRSVGSENAETKVKRVHADDEYVWFGHEHHDDLDKTVRLRRHVDLSGEAGESLVRLLAAYVAEGSASTVETTSSRFGASIASSDREWLETLQTDYYRLFDGTTASIVASDRRGERRLEYGDEETTYEDTTRKLQMTNELAAVFFREFAGQTSRGKRVPSFVYHLSDELQGLFVETMVEGDGSRAFPRYSESYRERNFDYETASRELAAGLSTLLTQRDRKHSLNYRDEKGTYTIRTCDYYRSGRDPVVTEVDHDGYVYDLAVAENQNFVDGVGGIVLHNTDSVMLELGGEIDREAAIDRSFAIAEEINDSYDEFAREQLNAAQHRFQIEFEKLYRRFFQAGKKKRYAGHVVWKEGKDVDDVDITGFEYKRSDIAPITKEVQREVIDMIVRGEDVEDVKSYVSDVIDDFEAGNVDLDDVGIPGGIGKRLDAYDTDTAQVRGAKYANLLLGTNFGRGSKPKRLYIEKNGVHPDYYERVRERRDVGDDPLFQAFRRDVSEGDGVICFEYADQVPEEFAIDWEKMLDKTLKGPIARVLEGLDVSWEEVRTGQEQTGLGNFM